ncbi:hypothetical protein KP509_31G067300 [Ceratopteris richardii]|uniref:J domain-containing protein n=1 Tax=Ceratopteris richardii TaxID=49495 RepID=A0A8T2QYV8_CERRI|nr:hypothetical protein KP509_31G067300 [Ceratopteris richardii]
MQKKRPIRHGYETPRKAPLGHGAAMDPYKVLGVRREATKEEIKKAFRKLALQCHPDRHVQATKQQQDAAARRFREVSEAYEVLSDPSRRAFYNRDGRYPGSAKYSDPHSSHHSYNQWHRQRYREYASSRNRSSFWSFRISMSPMDVFFHAVLAGTLIFGLLYGGSIGTVIWKDRNAGVKSQISSVTLIFQKSFEDVLRAKEQREQENEVDK